MFGGVTSAVVALPVALAFGVATGLGPAAGLYGAIELDAVVAVPILDQVFFADHPQAAFTVASPQ